MFGLTVVLCAFGSIAPGDIPDDEVEQVVALIASENVGCLRWASCVEGYPVRPIVDLIVPICRFAILLVCGRRGEYPVVDSIQL